MTKNSATAGPPSTSTWSSCFIGCFGSSGEKTELPDEVNSRVRQRRRIFKWSLKKPPTKTVPVDLTTVPRKSKSVNDAPATSYTTSEIKKYARMVKESHAPVTSSEQKTGRKKWAVAVKSENGIHKEMKPGTKSATGPGLASPEEKAVTATDRPFVSSPLKPLTQSKSLLPPKRRSVRHAPPTGGGVDGGVLVLGRTPPSGGEFDSIIGMSIILVVLVVMVLWGKLCAIVCTAAWFFIAPRLVGVRAREHSSVDTPDKPMTESGNNLESVEYKKKVVLEGLLQRNHRSHGGQMHRKSTVNLEIDYNNRK